MLSAEYPRWIEREWERKRDLMTSLKSFSEKLIEWNKNTFGCIFKRKRCIKKRLEGVMTALGVKVTVGLLKLEARLKREWSEVLLLEEMLWMQKSCIDWIKLGDKNTRYFHTSTLIKRMRNKVKMLKDENGCWVEDGEPLKKMAVDYYSNLFNSEREGCYVSEREIPVIEEETCNEMVRVCIEEEVKRALRDMGSYKAPGPNGYPAIFFKKTWSMVGEDVCSFVRSVIGRGEITESAAETLLVLIPKETKPTTIRGFRPLSLCNITMKLVSKIIVNRLKEVWKNIISPFQASFVPGRQSVDNVVLCQEFVISMRYTKAKKGTTIIKPDLEKAYDRLEWDFIDETMRDAGLPNSLVEVIMRVVIAGS